MILNQKNGSRWWRVVTSKQFFFSNNTLINMSFRTLSIYKKYVVHGTMFHWRKKTKLRGTKTINFLGNKFGYWVLLFYLVISWCFKVHVPLGASRKSQKIFRLFLFKLLGCYSNSKKWKKLRGVVNPKESKKMLNTIDAIIFLSAFGSFRKCE